MELTLNLNSLYRSNSKAVLGEVYFKSEKEVFPEVGWTDFVVVILTWWNQNLLAVLTNKKQKKYEFIFMDGPMVAGCTKKRDGILEFECYKNNKSGKQVFFICQSSIEQFRITISKQTEKLIEELIRRDWISEELQKLREAWTQVSQYKN